MLIFVKRDIYIDINDVVFMADLKNCDERTIKNATDLRTPTDAGSLATLLKLRSRERDIIIPIGVKVLRGKYEELF